MGPANINVFPNEKWVSVEYQICEGNSISLILKDDRGDQASFCIFPRGGGTNHLAKQLREAAEKLPNQCECCGQEIEHD